MLEGGGELGRSHSQNPGFRVERNDHLYTTFSTPYPSPNLHAVRITEHIYNH